MSEEGEGIENILKVKSGYNESNLWFFGFGLNIICLIDVSRSNIQLP